MKFKNYKTLLKEIKDLNKWEDSLCSWIEIFNYKTALLLRIDLLIKCNPYEKSTAFLCARLQMDKLILKSIWKCKRLRILNNLEKEESKKDLDGVSSLK